MGWPDGTGGWPDLTGGWPDEGGGVNPSTPIGESGSTAAVSELTGLVY